MKIYVAAPWAEKQCARKAATVLTEAGHVITSDWLNEGERDYGNGYYGALDHRCSDHAVDLQERAIQDISDIRQSEAMVLLNAHKSEGKTVETGMAIILGIPVFVVGKPTNVFHYLDLVRCYDSLEEVINAIADGR